MNDQIDMNLLRVFDALMRHRNVTAAARELGLTQSSTSNALDRLRRRMNDRLLERRGNGMQPTRLAEDIWPALAEGLGRIRDGIAAGQSFDPGGATGSFRIGMHDYAQAVLGPALVAHLRAAAPGMDVVLLPVGSVMQDDLLHDGTLDLILRAGPGPASGLNAETLLTESFLGLVAADHPLAPLPQVTLADYLAHPHVLVSSRGITQGNVDAGLATLGLQRRVGCTAPDFEAAARIAAGTDLILTAGAALQPGLSAKLGLVSFALPLAVPGFALSMLWLRRNDRAPSHLWLRDQLRHVAGKVSGPVG